MAQMLSRSSVSKEPHLTRVVESTKAVVFLGTPHRGSPDLAAAGDLARSFVSFLGVETSPAILHALGLMTTDLERAQESFSALWLQHSFHVKTFQEGLGLTGINIGGLGKKVVPDSSSSLGDPREHAETIQANHREMCRFHGPEDPGYLQVSGELRSVYLTIEEGFTHQGQSESPLVAPDTASAGQDCKADDRASVPISITSLDLRGPGGKPFTETEKAYLRSLWFPSMNARRHNVALPASGTCSWLFGTQEGVPSSIPGLAFSDPCCISFCHSVGHLSTWPLQSSSTAHRSRSQ